MSTCGGKPPSKNTVADPLQVSEAAPSPNPLPSKPDMPHLDSGFSSAPLLKRAFYESNKHFVWLLRKISFILILAIAVFVPFQLAYINTFGPEHFIVKAFEFCMHGSLGVLAMIMTGFYMFELTHPEQEKPKFLPFTHATTLPLVIEGFKALIVILAGLFLFIVPGLIKQIHFMFLPYVVCFNRLYHQRKISALKHSQMLSKGLRWHLLFLFIVFPFFLSLGFNNITSFLTDKTFEHAWYIKYPLFMFVLYMVSMAMVYLSSLLYLLYAAKDKELITSPY